MSTAKITRQGKGLTENIPAFLVFDQFPEGGGNFCRKQRKSFPVNCLVMLNAEPSDVEWLTVILMVALDVIRIPANLAGWSLEPVVGAEHIEPAAAQFFPSWVLLFERHSNNRSICKSLIQ